MNEGDPTPQVRTDKVRRLGYSDRSPHTNGKRARLPAIGCKLISEILFVEAFDKKGVDFSDTVVRVQLERAAAKKALDMQPGEATA
eukprot:COSAG02_NODE_18315_length_946_cov_0.971665_1_plen_85_part_10